MREELKVSNIQTDKLINLIVLRKYTLLLNLMPATPSRKAVSRGMFTSVLRHPLFWRVFTNCCRFESEALQHKPPTPLNSAERWRVCMRGYLKLLLSSDSCHVLKYDRESYLKQLYRAVYKHGWFLFVSWVDFCNCLQRKVISAANLIFSFAFESGFF